MAQGKARYNKIIKANEISFFGVFKYSVTNKKKNFKLLYENENLKFISVGSSKKINKNRLYKIYFISDSLTILSYDFYGRYHIEDTLMFTENKCLQKQTYYSIEGFKVSSTMPFMIEIKCFEFAKDNLIGFSERFQRFDEQKETLNNISIKAYFDKKLIIDATKPNYTETLYENIDEAKMSFFASFFGY